MLCRSIVCFFLLPATMLCATEMECRQQVLYHFARSRLEKGIEVYLENYAIHKQHDLAILEQLAHLILEKGCTSSDMEEQMLSLYGIRTAKTKVSLAYFGSLLRSRHPGIQAATLQVIAEMHDDSIDHMIASALKSDHLMVRIEALHFLAQRRSKQTIGQLEALLNLLHPRARPFFTELYGVCGTAESISRLRQLINDRDMQVRLSALITAAKYGYDELIPTVRSCLGHCDPAIKEASATTLGSLQDLEAKDALKTASKSPFNETKLASLLALYQLGELEPLERIKELAREGNLFAIFALRNLSGSEGDLEQLLTHTEPNVRVNAALALLEKGRIGPKYVIDFLSLNPEIIVCSPHTSLGRSLSHFKLWNPLSLKKEERAQVRSIMIEMQSHVLEKAINLPEDSFMEIVRAVFTQKQLHLIPLAVRLLENKQTQSAVALLEEKAQQTGSPFIRANCLLALYRLGKSEALNQQFIQWVQQQKGDELLQFRHMREREEVSIKTEASPYKLTPEEKSALFLEALESIALRHEDGSTALILRIIKDGHPKNRFALAGLLLKSIN